MKMGWLAVDEEIPRICKALSFLSFDSLTPGSAGFF